MELATANASLKIKARINRMLVDRFGKSDLACIRAESAELVDHAQRLGVDPMELTPVEVGTLWFLKRNARNLLGVPMDMMISDVLLRGTRPLGEEDRLHIADIFCQRVEDGQWDRLKNLLATQDVIGIRQYLAFRAGNRMSLGGMALLREHLLHCPDDVAEVLARHLLINAVTEHGELGYELNRFYLSFLALRGRHTRVFSKFCLPDEIETFLNSHHDRTPYGVETIGVPFGLPAWTTMAAGPEREQARREAIEQADFERQHWIELADQQKRQIPGIAFMPQPVQVQAPAANQQPHGSGDAVEALKGFTRGLWKTLTKAS